MELPRVRFTVRGMMVAVAALALAFSILVGFLRWFLYPRIIVTIVNETSAPIRDLRLTFLRGERTAELLGPGGVAVTEIESGGDAGIFFSYRDSRGTLREAEPLHHESGNRGFLEVHVTNEGTRLVNGIRATGEPPAWSIRVKPTGPMTVK